MVIEDMYIPGRSAQYLYKGYKIVKLTVEGTVYVYLSTTYVHSMHDATFGKHLFTLIS